MMKTKNKILSLASMGLMAIFTSNSALAMPPSMASSEAGKRVIDRDGKYSKTGTLELCVGYHKLASDSDKQDYLKELDLRAQLSTKDHELIDQHKVVPGMTMCGMYMSIGTPMSQKTRQLRPMTYKTVHVYQDIYTVTQSGMVVETYERKEGSIPPKLAAERPLVAPSPTLK